MNTWNQKGFTLVELLVVLVLGTLVLLATYETLSTNTRVYAANTARSQGQQTLRAGADILSGELREISIPGGDLIDIGDDSVKFRAQRTFGLVCAVDYSASPPTITSFRVGPAFEAGDTVFVFHDNDPDLSSDDEWFSGVVTAVALDVGSTDLLQNNACGGSPSQTLSIPMLRTTATGAPPDTVRVGAPIRGFDTFTLGLYSFDGEPYLARRAEESTEPDPLVGPLLASGGVAFRYFDSSGGVTKKPAEVTQIEVTLRYESQMRNFQSEPISDSVVVRVYPRN
ncbi:MAG: prepilin-type N-terminal cleavage/methylation domain-containing protein [Gemmatimonadota bacterium]|jgi:prepilin-type N-terminal cleavage/methylation domain-containing protein